MDKNILEKMLAEYDRNTDGILKKYGEKGGLDEISGVFRFLSGMSRLKSGLKQ